MSTERVAAELGMLPGPRVWASNLLADVSEGKSLLLLTPDTMAYPNYAEFFRRLADEHLECTLVEPRDAAGTGELEQQLRELFDIGVSVRGLRAVTRAIVKGEGLGPPRVLLLGWPGEAAGAFCQALGPSLHEVGLAPGEVPSFVVVAGLPEPAAVATRDLNSVELVVHWWWGVLSRTDVQGYVMVRRPDWKSVAVGVAVEIAGWNLDVAEMLCQDWNGERRSLAGLEESLRSRVPTSYDTPSVQPSSAAPAPTQHASWARGEVNMLEGVVTGPVAVDIHGEDWVDFAYWVAHARTYLPRIGLEQRRLQADLGRQRANREAMEAFYAHEPRSRTRWEFTDMRQGLGRRLDPEDLQRLKTLIKVRNAIAHYHPPTADALRELGWD